jgi:hypothetical protein
MLLNFGDRTRTGVFNMVWSLTRAPTAKLIQFRDALSDRIQELTCANSICKVFADKFCNWGDNQMIFGGLNKNTELNLFSSRLSQNFYIISLT